MVVDAAAASRHWGVELAKDAGTLHDLPSFVGCIGSDDQRIQGVREAGV